MPSTPSTQHRRFSRSSVFSRRRSTKQTTRTIINGTNSLVSSKLTVVKTWQPTGHSQSNLDDAIAKATTDSPNRINSALSAYVNLPGKNVAMQKLSFNSHLQLSGAVWHDGVHYEVFVKGSLEHVMAHSDMTENEREQAEAIHHSFAAQGYTVIAVAHGRVAHPFESISQLSSHQRLTFDGLVALKHTILPLARQIMQTLRDSGASIILLSGGHASTVRHIAQELGIISNQEPVFDCRRLTVLDDDTLRETVGMLHVFTHVNETSRQRILSLLATKHATVISDITDINELA